MGLIWGTAAVGRAVQFGTGVLSVASVAALQSRGGITVAGRPFGRVVIGLHGLVRISFLFGMLVARAGAGIVF